MILSPIKTPRFGSHTEAHPQETAELELLRWEGEGGRVRDEDEFSLSPYQPTLRPMPMDSSSPQIHPPQEPVALEPPAKKLSPWAWIKSLFSRFRGV